MSVLDQIPDYVSLAALGGTALLTPLYLSQHRDVVRLRQLKEHEPEHPARDIAASEVLLDRAEAELEEILDGDRASRPRFARHPPRESPAS